MSNEKVFRLMVVVDEDLTTLEKNIHLKGFDRESIVDNIVILGLLEDTKSMILKKLNKLRRQQENG